LAFLLNAGPQVWTEESSRGPSYLTVSEKHSHAAKRVFTAWPILPAPQLCLFGSCGKIHANSFAAGTPHCDMALQFAFVVSSGVWYACTRLTGQPASRSGFKIWNRPSRSTDRIVRVTSKLTWILPRKGGPCAIGPPRVLNRTPDASSTAHGKTKGGRAKADGCRCTAGLCGLSS
jgi:hypothetical protein